MKKFISSIAYIAIFFGLFILGCTKDFDIQDQFDYDVNVTMKDSGYVFEPSDLNLKIIPKRIVKGITYKVTYTVIEGDSYLEFGKPVATIKKDESFNMPETNEQVLQFYPTKVGENKILITIEDSNGLKKTKSLVYKAKLAPFTFVLTPNMSTYTINARGAVTSTLIRDLDDTFTFNYTVENGTGILYNGNEEIPLGKPYKIAAGVNQLHYLPTSLGTHKLTVVATAFDGAVIKKTIDIIVDNVPFSLNATTVSTAINVNQEALINLELLELQKGITSTYEITHSFDSKGLSGVLTNSTGTVVNAGVFSPTSPGTYQYKFKAAAQGVSTITFKVKDSNGQVKEVSIVITITNVPFTLTGASTQKTILLNESTKLNFNIVPNTSDSKGVTYSFIYQAESGDGILIDGQGQEIPRGAPIAVNKGVFSLNYKPTSLGSHIINYTVTDNNGETRSGKIEMEAVHSAVTFNVSTVTQSYVNVPINLDFIITPQTENNLTYEMNYFVTGGQGVLKKTATDIVTPGEYHAVNKGAFTYEFTPSIAGNFVLTFELKDNNGQIITKTVPISVINNDFTISTTGDGTLYVNTSKSINTYLSQDKVSSIVTYEVKYSIESGSTGNGVLSFEGSNVPYGVYAPTSVGAKSLTFTATEVGIINLKVEVKDSNGITHNSVVALEVKPINYTFSGASQLNSIFVNGSTPVNFDITESAVSGTQYEMKYVVSSGDGQIKNGSELESANIWYPVTVGSFSRNISGISVGSIEVTFTVRNKITLVEKTQTLTITVNPSIFSFSATPTNVNNNVAGQGTNINFNLIQTGGTDDVYTMTFTTTGSGTFNYNGNSYSAGQIIPISVGATNGSYVGTSVGDHALVFEVTNQLNSKKSSNATVKYINNDFTLSTTGDGTLFMGQTQDFNVFLSQLLPDASITYQVRCVFESGTTGSGNIQKNGVNESLGVYSGVGLGTTTLRFVPTKPGLIRIGVEVVNNSGLKKTSLILLNVQSTDFDISSALTNSNIVVGVDNGISFDLSENLASGTEYEMKYVINQGNATLKNAGATLTQNVWENVTVGSYFRDLVVNSSDAVSITFSVRNKLSGVTKTTTLSTTPYTNPTLTNVLTGENNSGSFNCGGGQCTRTYSKYISFNPVLNAGATLTSVKITVEYSNDDNGATVGTKNYTITNFTKATSSSNDPGIAGTANGYITFKWFDAEISQDYFFNNKNYTLEITDSNGVISTMTGVFTGSLTDNQ